VKIQNVKTTQVLILPFDRIPVNRLVPSRNLQRCGKLFNFVQMEVSEDNAGNVVVRFKHGLYPGSAGDCALVRLEVMERKIVFEIEGTSEDANAFWGDLAEFLAGLANVSEEGYLESIVKAEESEIVSELDFSMERLVSPAYLEFVRTTVASEATSEIAEARVRPVSLEFEVRYQVTDEILSEQRINVVPKPFVVGPRKGSTIADRVYYSKAPLDTEAHTKLLEKLERVILRNEG
jgi:hypothetical protein